jgi:hypothetical protein
MEWELAMAAFLANVVQIDGALRIQLGRPVR